jgi:hypothetical protein
MKLQPPRLPRLGGTAGGDASLSRPLCCGLRDGVIEPHPMRMRL